MMSVRRIDTARTTSLPVMDMADAIAAWHGELKLNLKGDDAMPQWQAPATPKSEPGRSNLRPGDRVSVYWTESQAWFEGTYTSSRIEPADDGGTQRASRIVYDAVGQWKHCTAKQLTSYHCLDDEQWQHLP